MLFRSDRKSTRLNSSHTIISYAVFCLKKKHAAPLTSRRRPGPARCAARARPRRAEGGAPTGGGRGGRDGRGQAGVARPFFFFLMIRRPPRFTRFPPTALFQ